MNVRETAEILGYLAAAWPKYELTEETVQVWVDQFASADFEKAQKAAKEVVANDEWFPSVARFRERLALQLRLDPTELGCNVCENGFVVLDNGDVTFCSNCRSSAPVLGAAPQFGGRDNWQEGLGQARKQLGPVTE